MTFKFNNYLKYLTLVVRFNDEVSGSIILNELSKSLPLSLHYLDLNLVIRPDDLRISLENCKQVELKKLLIKNRSKENVDNTLKVIKDFVKEKNIKFLAYKISNLPSKYDVCHKNLENLVEDQLNLLVFIFWCYYIYNNY